MKNNILLETVAAAGLLVLAVLVLNPFHFFMPDTMVMLALLGLLVLFTAFALFVLRERAADEREASHRLFAGRAAFLAGAAVLVAGLVAQGYVHAVDPWLVWALVAMVLFKIGARLYSDRWQ